MEIFLNLIGLAPSPLFFEKQILVENKMALFEEISPKKHQGYALVIQAAVRQNTKGGSHPR